jgi:hypothetical protein
MSAQAITTISTLRQRNLIERAAELKAIIDGAKDEFDSILDEFKAQGDGDYVGRDGRSVQVRTSVAATLDSKIVKGMLTPAQIIEATKNVTRCAAKLI